MRNRNIDIILENLRMISEAKKNERVDLVIIKFDERTNERSFEYLVDDIKKRV